MRSTPPSRFTAETPEAQGDQDPEQGCQQVGNTVETDPGLLTVLSVWPRACLFPVNSSLGIGCCFAAFPYPHVQGTLLFYTFPWASEFVLPSLYSLTSHFTACFNSRFSVHPSIHPSMHSFLD